MAAAPTAANEYWQSETWPAFRMSNPSDKKRMTSQIAVEYTGRSLPMNVGTKQTRARKAPPARRRTLGGAYQASGQLRTAANLWRMSLARGVTIRAMNKTMKGKDGGRPARVGTWIAHWVETAPRTPMRMPPR